MITYPILKGQATIGVTAPSSGVRKSLHPALKEAIHVMEEKGFHVHCGETIWTQHKAKSAPVSVRAKEWNEMIGHERVDMIMPPWGGELLLELLEHISFENFPPKWVVGYSDTSTLLLAITLKTGIATAHGPNLMDLRSLICDDTTAMWKSVLSTRKGETVLQYASTSFQKKWNSIHVQPFQFNLTERTQWKSVGGEDVSIEGRLLGGCIDVIRHLIGTPFGDVEAFRNLHIPEEHIVWYLENCELTTTDVRRSLLQMKLAGWFRHCSGIVFGRSEANTPVDEYTIEDVYNELAEELNIPILYDVDCGHVPPQMTFVNGAYGEFTLEDGNGTFVQKFV